MAVIRLRRNIRRVRRERAIAPRSGLADGLQSSRCSRPRAMAAMRRAGIRHSIIALVRSSLPATELLMIFTVRLDGLCAGGKRYRQIRFAGLGKTMGARPSWQNDENWIDIGTAGRVFQGAAQARHGTESRARDILQGWTIRSGFECVQSRRRAARRRRLDGDYIVCPWHNWKFHRCSGLGEPGFEEDRVPAYPVKVENGRVFVDLAAAEQAQRKPHAPHPLARKVERARRSVALAGISTTAMDAANPRFSGSDHLLEHALGAAGSSAPRRG